MRNNLSMADLEIAVEALNRPETHNHIMVVSPQLYPVAHKALHTSYTRFGMHYHCEYQGEKWWEIHKLPKKKPFEIKSVIHTQDYYGDNQSLPRAMKKRGYLVKYGKIAVPQQKEEE